MHRHDHTAFSPARSRLRLAALLLAMPLLLQACGGSGSGATDTSGGTYGGTSPDGQSAKMTQPGTTSTLDSVTEFLKTSWRRRNKAPVISGTPATQTLVGIAYVFAPTAKDLDGDRLSFSIANKPAWAQFDSVSGMLSGTPGSTHVGRTIGVKISVTDGRTTSSLPAFDLEVLTPTVTTPPPPPPPTTYQATVSWAAPTTNTDGTPLTDLAGYKLYYGQNTQSLDRVVQIAAAASNTQVVQNLTSGTWYFAVAAVNAAGLESALSAVASRSYP